MNAEFPISRYIPSIQNLFYALVVMTIGLTVGKWLTLLFDGSSFLILRSGELVASQSLVSSTVMAMRRSIELLPVCFAASCVTFLFLSSVGKTQKGIPVLQLLAHSWKVGGLLSGILAVFFILSAVLTIVDIAITMGKMIPFLGALFSLLYGLIYPIITLISLIVILFSYFVALGPLHVIGLLEQEKVRDEGAFSQNVPFTKLLRSVSDLVAESGTSVRSVLICGWSFGVIPLFCYQLFLASTLSPAQPQDGLGLTVLQNIMMSLSTAAVEAPFLLISLFCSFFFVAKARDTSSL